MIRLIATPRVTLGYAQIACPFCGAEAPACALRFPCGRSYACGWRCAVCGRHGVIVRDPAAKALGLEMSADYLPNVETPEASE